MAYIAPWLQQQASNVYDQAKQTVQNDPWTLVNLVDDFVGSRNAWVASPLVAFEAARAPRGEKLNTALAGGLSLAALPAMMKYTSKALHWVAPVVGGPAFVGSWVAEAAVFVGGIVVAGTLNSLLRGSLHRNLRQLHERERKLRSLEMGGDFRDTATAYALRQRAITDMSGAFTNARSYLGREGMFQHR